MNTPIGPEEINGFRACILARFGLEFDETKFSFLAEILARRSGMGGAAAYLQRLENKDAASELRSLAVDLTVTETYFFRNIEQFHAVREIALPQRLAAKSSPGKLRILSAGCASGDEPYTLAIVAKESVPDAFARIQIRAIDVNAAMLQKAARGHYTGWVLRETPKEVQARWFRNEGKAIVLDPAIRGAVEFLERNLKDDDSELWQPESYDIIFCRNVLMYFQPEVARAIVRRVSRSLVAGGYLFLGHAETLRGLSGNYHLCHTHETFYYQRKDRLSDDLGEREQMRRPATFGGTSPLPEAGWAETWIETIQAASTRIQRLAEVQGAPASPKEVMAVATPRSSELTFVLELLKRERFSEALELFGQLSPESSRDPEAMLLRAALLTHSGQLEAAEKCCLELLAADELNTGAHYLLALCREGAGDRPAAIDHDRTAAYLDPGFAMPRMHLGLMARRAGDIESARRELGQALLLLQREDAARLLLFGGGFSREALTSLCRMELLAAGGRP